MNVAIINCFDTYQQRVDMIYRFFGGMGHNAKIYTSNFLHSKKKYRENNEDDVVMISVRRYQKNLSLARMYSHMKFAEDVYSCLRKSEVDLIWVLIPPNSLVKQIYQYKERRPDVKVVIDIIDLWPETMPIPDKLKKTVMFEWWKKLRENFLGCADHIVTECDLYRQKIPQRYQNIKVSTLYLARAFHDYAAGADLPNDKLALCYLGSINNIIDIDVICSLIREIRKYKKVLFHIVGNGEKKDELIKCAGAAGAEVKYHGTIYDRTVLGEILNSCHYGLNIMKKTVFVGLTMKSMNYFEAGLPIINNIAGDTWEFCEQYKIGINLDDEGWIKKVFAMDIPKERVRNFSKKMFSEEAFYKKMKEIYLQL